MKLLRRFATITSLVMALTMPVTAAEKPENVVQGWYHLVLELIRHTPTYTPPVASRALGYLGVTAFEATASGDAKLQTLAGQLTDLSPVPAREAGATYNEAIILDAALAAATHDYFENTGPTGQRAIAAMEKKSAAAAVADVPQDVVARSEAYGKAVAAHIFDWSQADGGAKVENLGFPMKYDLKKGPGLWVPTNPIALQQLPLLPEWGSNRPFAMPKGVICDVAPPIEYSEDTASAFYKEAQEVVDVKKNLTDEQRFIARFWADDAMLTTTPPGHWISIALQIMARDNRSVEDQVDLLARLGVAQADAFIGCWKGKYQYNVIRPISYIRKSMDPKWEPMLNTPPFPEYPSGHSTQSGAAATVMTTFFGDNFAFEDSTYTKDGVKPRSFASFNAAADEAALSRIYGGIHFRAAVENGQVQGKCIGTYAANLKTRT